MTAVGTVIAVPSGTISTIEPDRVMPSSAIVSYRAERYDGADAVLAAMDAAGPLTASGAFQSRGWLQSLYETLAQDLGAKPVGIAVHDAATGALAYLLPLVETRRGRLRVLSFPLLGVSDYGGPILGPKSPLEPAAIEQAWRTMVPRLGGADLLQLQNMPTTLDGRANPLARHKRVAPARHRANSLVVEDTVEALLRARGKKYRKEAERCFRLLAERGPPEFRRAETDDDIAKAYAVLQEQQASRRREAGGGYVLDHPEYARFYESILRDGLSNGFASIFTLRAGSDICAALLGITHGTSFTLLRISTAGEDWKRLSPGRLIVLETMRALTTQGIRTFDMGIGDYAFKHGFGTDAAPLWDLELPLTWAATPAVVASCAKARVRQSPRLMALAKRLQPRS